MKLFIWLDDKRQAPSGYICTKSVNEVITLIKRYKRDILILDLDDDLGEYAKDGGQGKDLLRWCINHEFFPIVRIHSVNMPGRKEMQELLDNYWGNELLSYDQPQPKKSKEPEQSKKERTLEDCIGDLIDLYAKRRGVKLE